jgi:hypothetical protein
MSKKDYENRNRILLQQLQIMQDRYDEFVEKLGQKGFYERIDAILDEYNQNKRQIRKLENEGK